MSDALKELFGALFLGVIAFIVLWMAWRKHFFEKPKQELVTAPISFFHVLAAFAIYFGAAALFLTPVLSILKRMFVSLGSSDTSLYFSVTLQLVVSSLIACLLLLFWKTTSPQIAKAVWRSKTKDASYSQDLAVGALAWVISFPLLLFASQLLNLFVYVVFHIKELPDQTAVYFLRMTMNHPLSFIFNIISIVILAPLIEEFLFRGFLQTYIRKFFRPVSAIALSSICFSCFHFSPEQGLGNIPIIGSLFILALFLGYVYERQGSLLASISLHATFNALSILNLYFLGGTPKWAL